MNPQTKIALPFLTHNISAIDRYATPMVGILVWRCLPLAVLAYGVNSNASIVDARAPVQSTAPSDARLHYLRPAGAASIRLDPGHGHAPRPHLAQYGPSVADRVAARQYGGGSSHHEDHEDRPAKVSLCVVGMHHPVAKAPDVRAPVLLGSVSVLPAWSNVCRCWKRSWRISWSCSSSCSTKHSAPRWPPRGPRL